MGAVVAQARRTAVCPVRVLGRVRRLPACGPAAGGILPPRTGCAVGASRSCRTLLQQSAPLGSPGAVVAVGVQCELQESVGDFLALPRQGVQDLARGDEPPGGHLVLGLPGIELDPRPPAALVVAGGAVGLSGSATCWLARYWQRTTRAQASSAISRTSACSTDSPSSTVPPGKVHRRPSMVTITTRPSVVKHSPSAWVTSCVGGLHQGEPAGPHLLDGGRRYGRVQWAVRFRQWRVPVGVCDRSPPPTHGVVTVCRVHGNGVAGVVISSRLTGRRASAWKDCTAMSRP
jgi:hypothetical protein